MTQLSTSDAAQLAILERLTGATGDPDRVVAVARASATRALGVFGDALADELATSVDIEISAVEVVRLADAMPASDDRDVICVAKSGQSADALTMQIDPAAMGLILNAYLGGDPEFGAAPIVREATAIELDIARTIFEALAKALNGTGERSLGLRFPIAAPVCGAALKRLVVRDGPGVRITFEIAADGGGRGLIHAMLPQRVLAENRSEMPAELSDTAAWRARFGSEVLRSEVTVNAMVPMASMTLGELACMTVGQVIELPEDAQAQTRLTARDRTLFSCEFGKLGQNYTVRIKEPFDAGRDFIDGLMG